MKMNEKKLTPTEKKTLTKLVSVIRKGQKAFLETAKAIRKIGVDKLFDPSHATLFEFCAAEFDMSSTETTRYRKAGGVLNDLAKFSVLPTCEGQCRELAKLSDSAHRVDVWKRVVDRGEKITAAMIKEEIDGPITKDSPNNVEDQKSQLDDLITEAKQQASVARTIIQEAQTKLASDPLALAQESLQLLLQIGQHDVDDNVANIIKQIVETGENLLTVDAVDAGFGAGV